MSAPLNSLTTGSYEKLEWRQRKTSSLESDLSADGRPIGTLTFRSAFGTLATAEIGSACWTFKRVGFFQQKVEVRACGSDAPVAEFVNATWKGGGTLAMKGGPTFRATSNWWNTRWQIEDEHGRVLVRFEYGGVFRMSAQVKISTEARALAELPLLVAVSWYLVLMLAQDAASSAAIIG